MKDIERKVAIQTLVAVAIENYAEGFRLRHEGEIDNPNGVINMKVHNVFIEALGEDIQYYAALVRSFDSSLGNMIERLAISIARLSFSVRQNVEGPLSSEQTRTIAELLEAYKSRDKTPNVQDYQVLRTSTVVAHETRRHESDYYLIDNEQKEMHNFIETPICMGAERLKNPKHPTQKPVKVLEHIVKLASKPGDLVFDPFMGVGSTGIAALNLERRFVGVEIDEDYFNAADIRLKQQISQLQFQLQDEF